MSERLGPVTLAPRNGTSGGGLKDFGLGGKPYGAAMADAIDAEVERLLKEAASEARRLFETRRRELDGLAGALLEHETWTKRRSVVRRAYRSSASCAAATAHGRRPEQRALNTMDPHPTVTGDPESASCPIQ